VLGPESAERDITATSRIGTSGAFRLIHIDEYAVYRDLSQLATGSQQSVLGFGFRLSEAEPCYLPRYSRCWLLNLNSFLRSKERLRWLPKCHN
jgi:hypothetical protein